MERTDIPAAMSTAQRPVPNPEEWTALRQISPIDHPVSQLHLFSPPRPGDESSYGLLDVNNLVPDTTQLFAGNAGDADTTLNRLAQEMVNTSRPATSGMSSTSALVSLGVDDICELNSDGDSSVPSALTHSAIVSDANAVARALSNQSIGSLEPSVASLITALSQQQTEVFTDSSAHRLSSSVHEATQPEDWSRDVQRIASSLTGLDNFKSASHMSGIDQSATASPTTAAYDQAMHASTYSAVSPHNTNSMSSTSAQSSGNFSSSLADSDAHYPSGAIQHYDGTISSGDQQHTASRDYEQVRMVPGQEVDVDGLLPSVASTSMIATASESLGRFPLPGQEHSPTGSASNVSASARPLGEGQDSGGDQASLFRNYLNPSDAGVLLAQYIASQQQHTLGDDNTGDYASQSDHSFSADSGSPDASMGAPRGCRRPLSSPLGSSLTGSSNVLGMSPSISGTPVHGLSPSHSLGSVSDLSSHGLPSNNPYSIPRTQGVGVGLSQGDLASSADSASLVLAPGSETDAVVSEPSSIAGAVSMTIEQPPWLASLRQGPSGQPYDRPDVLGEVNVSGSSVAAPIPVSSTALTPMSLADIEAHATLDYQSQAPSTATAYQAILSSTGPSIRSSATAKSALTDSSPVQASKSPRSVVSLAARFDQPAHSSSSLESSQHYGAAECYTSWSRLEDGAAPVDSNAAAAFEMDLRDPDCFADMPQQDGSLYGDIEFAGDGYQQLDGEDFVSTGAGVSELLDADQQENALEYQFDPAFINSMSAGSDQLDFSSGPVFTTDKSTLPSNAGPVLPADKSTLPSNAGPVFTAGKSTLPSSSATHSTRGTSQDLPVTTATAAAAVVPICTSSADQNLSTASVQAHVVRDFTTDVVTPSKAVSGLSAHHLSHLPRSTGPFSKLSNDSSSADIFQSEPSPGAYFAARSSVLGGLDDLSIPNSGQRPHFDMGHPLFSPPGAGAASSGNASTLSDSVMFSKPSSASNGDAVCSPSKLTQYHKPDTHSSGGKRSTFTSYSGSHLPPSLVGLDDSAVQKHVQGALHMATPPNVRQLLQSSPHKSGLHSDGYVETTTVTPSFTAATSVAPSAGVVSSDDVNTLLNEIRTVAEATSSHMVAAHRQFSGTHAHPDQVPTSSTLDSIHRSVHPPVTTSSYAASDAPPLARGDVTDEAYTHTAPHPSNASDIFLSPSRVLRPSYTLGEFVETMNVPNDSVLADMTLTEYSSRSALTVRTGEQHPQHLQSHSLEPQRLLDAAQSPVRPSNMVTPGANSFPAAYLDGDVSMGRDSVASSAFSTTFSSSSSMYNTRDGDSPSKLSMTTDGDSAPAAPTAHAAHQYVNTLIHGEDEEGSDDNEEKTLSLAPGEEDVTPVRMFTHTSLQSVSSGPVETDRLQHSFVTSSSLTVATQYTQSSVGKNDSTHGHSVSRAEDSQLSKSASPRSGSASSSNVQHDVAASDLQSDGMEVTVKVSVQLDSSIAASPTKLAGHQSPKYRTDDRTAMSSATAAPAASATSATSATGPNTSVTTSRSLNQPPSSAYHSSSATAAASHTPVKVTVSPASSRRSPTQVAPSKSPAKSSPLPSPLQRVVQPKNIEKWLSELLQHSPGSSPRNSPGNSPGKSPRSKEAVMQLETAKRKVLQPDYISPGQKSDSYQESLDSSMSTLARNLSDSFRRDGAELLDSAAETPILSAGHSPPQLARQQYNTDPILSSQNTPTTTGLSTINRQPIATAADIAVSSHVSATHGRNEGRVLGQQSPLRATAATTQLHSHSTQSWSQIDSSLESSQSVVVPSETSFSTPVVHEYEKNRSRPPVPPSTTAGLSQSPRSSQGSHSIGPVVMPATYAVRGIQCVGVPVALLLPVRNSGTKWLKSAIELRTVDGSTLPEEMLSLFQVSPRMTLGPLKTDDIQITCLPHAAGSFSVELVMTSSPVIEDSSAIGQESSVISRCVLSVNAIEARLHVVRPPAAIPGLPEVQTSLSALTKADIDLGQTLAGTTRYHPVCLRNLSNISLPVRLLICSDKSSSVNTFSFVSSPDSLPYQCSQLNSTLTLLPPSPLTSLSTVACTSIPPCQTNEYCVAWICFKAPSQDSSDVSAAASTLSDYSCTVQVELDVVADFPLASAHFTSCVGWARLHAPRSMQALTFAASPDKPAHRTVPLRNVGNVPCNVELGISPPSALFTVHPTSFTAVPQQEVEVRVTFLCSIAQHSAGSYLVMTVKENGNQYELLLRGTTSDYLHTNGHAAALPAPDLAVSKSLLSCNRNQVTFAGVALRESREEVLTLCNTSYTEDVVLEISVPDHSDVLQVLLPVYKPTPVHTETHAASLGKSSQDQPVTKLGPQESIRVTLKFTARQQAAIKSFCLIRDLKHAMKFQIPLFAYGGHCDIQALGSLHNKPLTRIKLGQLGKQRSISKLVVENRGERDGFVKILCFEDEKLSTLVPAECLTVSPVDAIIPAGKSKQFLVIVEPAACGKHSVLGSRHDSASLAALCLYSGDELARCRWRRLCRTVGEVSSTPNSPGHTSSCATADDDGGGGNRSQPVCPGLSKAGLHRPVAGENLELRDLQTYSASASLVEEQQLFESGVQQQTIQIVATLTPPLSVPGRNTASRKKKAITTTAGDTQAMGDLLQQLGRDRPVAESNGGKSLRAMPDMEHEFDFQQFPPSQHSSTAVAAAAVSTATATVSTTGKVPNTRSAISSSSSKHMTDADWLLSPTLVTLKPVGHGENAGTIKIQNLSNQPCKFGVHWPGYLLRVSPDHGIVPARGSLAVSVTLKVSADISYPPSTTLTFTCGQTRKDVIINVASTLQYPFSPSVEQDKSTSLPDSQVAPTATPAVAGTLKTTVGKKLRDKPTSTLLSQDDGGSAVHNAPSSSSS
eukprot:scpid3164/ scgid5534/ Centrosomal protein of 192 kDa